jgi:hypothetical protein
MLIIAMLFAFAAGTGPMMVSAVTAGHFWAVSDAADGWCAEPSAQPHKAPVFKSCAKKINGQAIPCQQVPAIMPLPVACVAVPLVASYSVTIEPLGSMSLADSRFRPPQALIRA